MIEQVSKNASVAKGKKISRFLQMFLRGLGFVSAVSNDNDVQDGYLVDPKKFS